MHARTLLQAALAVSILAFAPAAFGQDDTDPVMPGIGQDDGGMGTSQDRGLTPTARENMPAGQTGKLKVIGSESGVQFRSGPAFLPSGAELANIHGDPQQGQAFVSRLRVPDDWRMPPNTGNTELHVTVLEGAVRVVPGRMAPAAGGAGASGGQMVSEGGFIVIPSNEAYSLMADQASVLEIHGQGAWNPQYVNASDDPRAGTRPASMERPLDGMGQEPDMQDDRMNPGTSPKPQNR